MIIIPSTKRTVSEAFKQYKDHRAKKKNVRDQNLAYLKGEGPNEILTRTFMRKREERREVLGLNFEEGKTLEGGK